MRVCTTRASLMCLARARKTRPQQTAAYDGPLDCARAIYEAEGVAGFAQGAGATFVGYAIAGSLSFGELEQISRSGRLPPPLYGATGAFAAICPQPTNLEI